MRTILDGALPQTSARSPDGYIRLPFSTLMATHFEHKAAWRDAELLEELISENLHAVEAGFCEWSTLDARQISLGWAWFTLRTNGTAYFAPGGISSNVMLVDAKWRDVGMHVTDSLLRVWLGTLQWRPVQVASCFGQGEAAPSMRAS